MQVFAHAGIGWALAEAGMGDRCFRQAVFLSALLPDIDGLSLVFGVSAYVSYHDRLTHSIPFGLVVSAVAMAVCRKCSWKILVFTQLGFWSHIVGDYFFSGWPLALWFPFSRAEIENTRAFWLGHPVNHLLNFAAMGIVYLLGRKFIRTPIEVFSVGFDRKVSNLLFKEKTLVCHCCNKATNERCLICGQPVCARHTVLSLDDNVKCTTCQEAGKQHDSPA